VGKRLALWALAKDYGVKDLVYSGPIYKSMNVEGDEIELTFDHVGGGLMAAKKTGPQSIEAPKPAETLEGFAIAGADKKWVWATAKIEGDTVVVSSPDVKEPVAVRYAFSMNPDKANLYNKAGLPASPFRTDGW
jgi:sialate O-acetylesterase